VERVRVFLRTWTTMILRGEMKWIDDGDGVDQNLHAEADVKR
jgi:hypothetical protein